MTKKLFTRFLVLMMCLSMVPLQAGAVHANEDTIFETKIEDSNLGARIFEVTYGGAKWGASTGYPDRFSNGDEHWVNLGAEDKPYLEMKFIGHKIEVYGTKAPNHGIYKISVDGSAPISFDAYSSKKEDQQLIGSIDGLEEGEHTLRLEVSGDKNAAATNNSGEVDFFKAYHKEIKADSLTLKQTNVQLDKGDKEVVKATLSPHYATTNMIQWTSSNDQVATVNSLGEVTAISAGDVTISATVKGTEIVSSVDYKVINDTRRFNAFVGTSDRHYLQKDYNTFKNGNNSEFTGMAWRDDVITSSIVVTSRNTKVEGLNAKISDFTSGENVIESNNASVRALKETNAYIGRGFSHGNVPTGPKEMVPDIIHDTLPVSVEANRVQPLWVSIDIPEDAKPGIYNGTITLESLTESDPITFNYTFEVLDLVQPALESDESYDLTMDIWQYPYTTARYYGIAEEDYFGDKHMGILKDQLTAYKEVGGDSITVSIVEDPWNQQTTDKYPSMIKWTKKADGTFSFDYDHFDKYVQLAMDMGINKQIKSFSMIPWENRIFYFDETLNKTVERRPAPGSTEWNQLWDQFLKSYVKHLDHKGWFDITYIAMDERPLSTMQPVIDIINLHPNKDGNTLKIHGAMNYNSVSADILDQIDDISINLGHTNHQSNELRELSEHRRSLGLTTTIYTCVGDYPSSFAFSNPSESAWTMWYAESQGVDGFMRWAFDAWVNDPLKDISHWYWESGDPFFVYPQEQGSDSTVPYSTPRYEKLKEGMRDVIKARYLKSIAPEHAEEIDALIQSIGRKYGKGNGYGATVAQSQEDRDFIDAEVRRMRAGINEIAKKIIEEENTVKEIEVTGKKLSFDLSEVQHVSLQDIVSATYTETLPNGTVSVTEDISALLVGDVSVLNNVTEEGTITIAGNVAYLGSAQDFTFDVKITDKSVSYMIETSKEEIVFKQSELVKLKDNQAIEDELRAQLAIKATKLSDIASDTFVDTVIDLNSLTSNSDIGTYHININIMNTQGDVVLHTKEIAVTVEKDTEVTPNPEETGEMEKPTENGVTPTDKLPATGVASERSITMIGALALIGGLAFTTKARRKES